MELFEYKFFREATLRICSSLDIGAAMDNCLTYIKQHLPAHGMSLMIYDPESITLKIMATALSSRINPPKSVPITPVLMERIKFLIEKNKMWIINDADIDMDKDSKKIVKMLWNQPMSFIMMALELDMQKLGLFTMYTHGKFKYSDYHSHLISLLHDPLSIAMKNTLMHQEVLKLKNMLDDDNRFLRKQIRNFSGDQIVGIHQGLKGVMKNVIQVAPLDSPVLLLGETGVGKDIIANAIHDASHRSEGPFIAVNCGAIPESIVESELFGHEKGAFTGAVSRKRGRFERAHKGTIFLDEIGEMPLSMQVKLLRVIQKREIERVGGTATVSVDIRVISATNRNIEEMVATGKLREDLWFRLNVFPIMIPPLRKRKEDIPSLIHYFVKRKCLELKIQPELVPSPDDIEKLQAYSWPGNVRELENIIERALIRNRGNPNGKLRHLHNDLLSANEQQSDSSLEEIRPLNETISLHITRALKLSKGKVEGPDGAAQYLGVHPNTLRGKMKKLNIPFGRNRKEY